MRLSKLAAGFPFGGDSSPSQQAFVPKARLEIFTNSAPKNIVDAMKFGDSQIGCDMPVDNNRALAKPVDIFKLDQESTLRLMGVRDSADQEYFALLIKDMENYSSYELAYDPEASQRKEELAELIEPQQLQYLENIAMAYDEHVLNSKDSNPIKTLTTFKYLAQEFERDDVARAIEILIDDNYDEVVGKRTHTTAEDHAQDELHREDTELAGDVDIKIESQNLKADTQLSPRLLADFAGLDDRKKLVFAEMQTLLKHRPFMEDADFQAQLGLEKLKQEFTKPELKLIFGLADFAAKLDAKDMEGQSLALKDNVDEFVRVLDNAQREDLADKVFAALEA